MNQRLKKPKILFIGRFPPPVTGAAKINETYFESKLIRKKFVLERVQINTYKKLEHMGRFDFRNVFGAIKNWGVILKKLIFSRPNLVYFEVAPTGFAFLRDSFYAFLCKIFRRKILFQLHARGIREKTKNSFWKNYYKFVFRNTKMILLSEILYSEVRRVIQEKNIYILPNGIKNFISDIEFKEALKKRNQNKIPVFLFISNMVEEKGALDVLKICYELDKKYIDFECLFVGPWQEKGFREKWFRVRGELKLNKKCVYLGAKYGEEKREIFYKTNFLVFPTKYKNESFPLVILEAFMYGVPVFSYDNGAISEIVKEEFLGHVSLISDWEELAGEIENSLSKDIEYEKIRKYFKKNYTSRIAEQKLANIFEKELK